MIAHYMAVRLEKAGLKWTKKRNDFCFIDGSSNSFDCIPWDDVDTSKAIYLPRLEQMTREIRRMGEIWVLEMTDQDKDCPDIYWCRLKKCNRTFIDLTPEHAVAQALIWLLRNGGKK